MDPSAPAWSPWGPAGRCLFGKALLAQTADCECAQRSAVGEQMQVLCDSPEAHGDCSALAALLRARARFALRLPAGERPLMHLQALRLQCGGLAALRKLLGDDEPDVRRAVRHAQQRWGSLSELPWEQLVPALVGWQPRRRGRSR